MGLGVWTFKGFPSVDLSLRYSVVLKCEARKSVQYAQSRKGDRRTGVALANAKACECVSETAVRLMLGNNVATIPERRMNLRVGQGVCNQNKTLKSGFNSRLMLPERGQFADIMAHTRTTVNTGRSSDMSDGSTANFKSVAA
ncbi:hypothetical protein CIHG_01791 [Coccidioides immitis H538.4]|uniref:Uncharacterized protein n=3 Tax=Coccidioides immitis TaxID=5501 RepID=A0A0J8U1M7_COCIT|nr:hypothetical protein CIRG_06115 [Coccidioides immitis RMSCC 2394]KMU80357.1 hypothetical protein CISG_02209 [Coccidioides immitis RMSCC 3703]KMU84007.1 hypothetical protein CIHG_01791 [Coccidioides immitis H538.4]